MQRYSIYDHLVAGGRTRQDMEQVDIDVLWGNLTKA